MPTPVGTSNLQSSPVSNHLLPDEGPKAIPLLLDFTTILSYSINLLDLIQQGKISMLQTIFVDLSDPLLSNVKVDMGGAIQCLVAKAQTQGYYNALVQNPPILTFTAAGAGGIAKIALINVHIPGSVWPTV